MILLVLGALALLAFGPYLAVALPVGALVLNAYAGEPVGVVAGYAALVLVYAWACWRWPDADCWWCEGKPRKRPPWWLRGPLGRVSRVGCLVCAGAGRYTRLGRRFTRWANSR